MDKVFLGSIDNLYRFNRNFFGLRIIWSLISRKMSIIIVIKFRRYIIGQVLFVVNKI